MTDTSVVKQDNVLLSVERLKKYYPVRNKSLFARHTDQVKAVDDVSFQIGYGETFGLVGESGCGKSTIARMILCLDHATDGQVVFEGVDITHMNERVRRPLRSKMPIIFQDPYSSLDPRQTVHEIVAEPLKINRTIPFDEINKEVESLLDKVGIPSFFAKRLPQELSGGQRQRVGVARALALKPKLIVCDEPVSALDVSIQAQVLNLLVDLQKEYHFSYLFIAHGMAVVKHISDRIGVMYLGKMMEVSSKSELYKNPLHPYSEALFSAIPIPDPEVKRKRRILEGDVPSPINPPSGCRFHPRCPYAGQVGERCRCEIPELVEVELGHWVACHKFD